MTCDAAPERAVRKVRWCQEPKMQEWMEGHDDGQPIAQLSREFEEAFGFPLSRPQVSLWRAANGRQSRRGNGGGRLDRRKPVGYEREAKGYVLVKVAPEATVPQSKDNWRLKHVVEWERANGRKVPEGHMVMFADGDRRNFDPSNLVAVPRTVIGLLNGPDAPEWHDADTLRSAVACCSLDHAIAAAEAAVP